MSWFTPEVIDILIAVLKAVVILLVVVACGAFMSFGERRLLGLFQNRYGPNRVGWGGSLQLVAFGAQTESPTGMAATPDMASTPVTVDEVVNGTVASLCPLLQAQPDRIVVTARVDRVSRARRSIVVSSSARNTPVVSSRPRNMFWTTSRLSASARSW